MFVEKLELLNELRRLGALHYRYETKIRQDNMWLKGKNWLNELKEVVENEIGYYEAQKKDIEKRARELLAEFEFYRNWFVHLEGNSPKMLIQMLGFIDWDKVKHPSTLHAYCGLVTPESEHFVKHNRKFKAIVYLQGLSFLGFPPALYKRMVNKEPKRGGGYARLYTEFRKLADRDHPDWNATRRFMEAFRKTCKVYLTHLYVVMQFLDFGRVEYHYTAQDHGYSYMPPYDRLNEKPDWLKELEVEYMKRGIKPAYI